MSTLAGVPMPPRLPTMMLMPLLLVALCQFVPLATAGDYDGWSRGRATFYGGLMARLFYSCGN